uniref:hypothetical protein n=1 Tax=Ningiella ruwaisensis TaxID=2364274 RepID=UPI0010A09A6B|nr:hypothetical protein [Ningiella ruwaisensis]
MKKQLLGSILLILPLSASAGENSKFSDRFEFSGFGRIIAGYLDEDAASYEGYENKLSVSEQSLIAVQTEFAATETLTIAAQLLAHSSEERQSGFEWFYLNYEPTKNWRFKAGKLRTPFFRYSDVIDVGFAYPWISAPQQVYSGYLFSNYEGASATYRFNHAGVNVDVEAYYGVYDETVFYTGQEVDVDVDQIVGYIVQTSFDNFHARASVISSDDFDVDLPEFKQFEQTLRVAGFERNADSLSFDGSAVGYQASLGYDNLQYFTSAEWVRITSDVLIIPDIDSYYVTAGYNFYPFQAHATFSRSDASYDILTNEIPKGVNPQLDALSFGYDSVISNLQLDSLDSFTLGLRWDFRPSMALKTEVTFLKGEDGERAFFEIEDEANFDRDATLYQVAFEWVF